jgi:Flp pilus assembly protein TadG
MRLRTQRGRRGALAVEGAVVYSVLFLLLFGLIFGGVGVCRYQQVACLAREAARYAAVHGSDWQKEANSTPCQTQDLLQQAVLPYAAGIDPAALQLQVQWINAGNGTASDWDTVSHQVTSTGPYGDPVSNHVRVTVSYTWIPQFLLAGPFSLASSSEMPLSY